MPKPWMPVIDDQYPVFAHILHQLLINLGHVCPGAWVRPCSDPRPFPHVPCWHTLCTDVSQIGQPIFMQQPIQVCVVDASKIVLIELLPRYPQGLRCLLNAPSALQKVITSCTHFPPGLCLRIFDLVDHPDITIGSLLHVRPEALFQEIGPARRARDPALIRTGFCLVTMVLLTSVLLHATRL